MVRYIQPRNSAFDISSKEIPSTFYTQILSSSLALCKQEELLVGGRCLRTCSRMNCAGLLLLGTPICNNISAFSNRINIY